MQLAPLALLATLATAGDVSGRQMALQTPDEPPRFEHLLTGVFELGDGGFLDGPFGQRALIPLLRCARRFRPRSRSRCADANDAACVSSLPRRFG